MAQPDWAPEGVDLTRPSAARVYDYFLGGSHNFEVDREAARQAMALLPDVAVHAQANRAFLYRAIHHLLDAGVRQFLDIGSGVPTVGNVHEVAQRVDPQARVAYVDIDPVAVAHSRAILDGNDRAAVVQQDLRQPGAILGHRDLRDVLDFDRPVGLLLVAILHAIGEPDDPHRIVRQLTGSLAPGSYLVVSHGTSDSQPELHEKFKPLLERGGYQVTPRSRAEVARFFDGLELVAPGVVWLSQWRPEHPDDVGDHPERAAWYAAVGRKP